MSLEKKISDIEYLLADIRSDYHCEIDEAQVERKLHEHMIEEMSESIQILQEQNADLTIENNYLQAKVIQLEMELVEAVTKQSTI